jgi:aminoglycoside 6'-N-acetyltransferase I
VKAATPQWHIERCCVADHPGWLALRQALWPASREEHVADMTSMTANPQRYVVFLAHALSNETIGLAEAALRTDPVNGAQSSPVAFLEGLYVVPHARRQGVAAALVAEVSRWARERGCGELFSDALLENQASHAMHRALGFAETERVIFFRKALI